MQKQDEIRTMRTRMEELEKKLRSDCAEEIRAAKQRLEQEKDAVKRAMKEQMETSRTEEKLLSSAVYEMGCFVNKIMVEKKRGLTGKGELKGPPAGVVDSFLASQINARAQSNAKKN